MSTVFYTFKAKDEATLQKQLAVILEICSTKIMQATGKIDGLEVQVFRTQEHGIVFRVLEAGYGLKNRLWNMEEEFPTCNYDDRADTPEADLPNEKVAEAVDRMISAKDYEIITIVEKDMTIQPHQEDQTTPDKIWERMQFLIMDWRNNFTPDELKWFIKQMKVNVFYGTGKDLSDE